MPDYYQLLELPPDADFDALRKAYYRQAMACHPDRFGGHPAKAEAFKQLVEAFNVLSDPVSRAAYDAARRSRAANDPPLEPFSACYSPTSSILDSRADDILEEMIVGNTTPRNTTLQTLLLDLERTERFCLFREAKTLFHQGRPAAAQELFQRYLAFAPLNILAQYYVGRCQLQRGDPRRAARAYQEALRLGARRRPPLQLARIRRELDQLRRTRLGAWSRLAAWWRDEPSGIEELPPDEALRREVGRAIHRALQAEQKRSRPAGAALPPGSRR